MVDEDAAISAGQIRSAERVLRLNAAIKSVSSISSRVENSFDVSELDGAEKEILELIDGLDQSLFDYSLKSIRDRREVIISLKQEEQIVKEAVLKGSLSDVVAWIGSLSKAQKREPLRSCLLSQALLLRSISDLITKLNKEGDELGHSEVEAVSREALALVQQYSASAPAEMSRKVRNLIEEAVREKNDMIQDRTVVQLALAPPTRENLDELQRKFSSLTLKSQLRIRNRLEDPFRSKIEAFLNRNSPDDYNKLKHVLEVGSTLLDFESSDIGDLFAQAWSRMDRYEQFFAAVKEATAAGIALSDQQRGLLLADPEAQLIKIKEIHRQILEAQRVEQEKLAAERLIEAQRLAEQTQREARRLEEQQLAEQIQRAEAQREKQRKQAEVQRDNQRKRAEAQRLEQQSRAEAAERLKQQEIAEVRLEEQQRAEAQRIEQQKRAEAHRKKQRKHADAQRENQRKRAEAQRIEQQSRAEAADGLRQQELAESRRLEEQQRAETRRIDQVQRVEAQRENQRKQAQIQRENQRKRAEAQRIEPARASVTPTLEMPSAGPLQTAEQLERDEAKRLAKKQRLQQKRIAKKEQRRVSIEQLRQETDQETQHAFASLL
jgi:hypothetical protein